MQIYIHIQKKSAWNVVKLGCSCFSWESILLLRNDVKANIYHSFLAFKELTQVLSVIIVMNVMLSWNHWVIFGNCSGLKERRLSIMQRIFCKFEEQTVLHKGIHWHRLGERRSSAKSSCNLTLIVLLDFTSSHWSFYKRNVTWSVIIQYSDLIMSAMASQITGDSIICWAVCSGAHQRKHQSSTSLAFVRGIHWWLVDSPHIRPVTWKMFPFDDVIMIG